MVYEMKIPKLLTGIIVTLFGAAVTAIPVIAPAGAYIMKAGAATMIYGGAAKTIRKAKGGDMLEHEKELLNKLKKGK